MSQHLIHTIRQSTLDAYYHPVNQPRFSRQARVIYEFLRDKYPRHYTRNELSVFLNIKINAVCGRVKELLDAGCFSEFTKKEIVKFHRNGR